MKTDKKIILASGSQTRKELLERSGIEFQACPSSVDEELIKSANPDLAAQELGLKLARAKALEISILNPDTYVIGADQVCEFAGEFLDKPGTIENCVIHLKKLSGKTHLQHCCTALAYNAEIIWENYSVAKLTMRNLSEEEILDYVELEQPINSCGSYMFEKNGKKLFSKVEGKEEVILGLAVVELLLELNRNL